MQRVRDRRVNVTVEVEEDLKQQKNYFLQETKSAKDTVKVCDWSSSRTIVAGPSTVHSIVPSIIFSIFLLVFSQHGGGRFMISCPRLRSPSSGPGGGLGPWVDGSISQDSSYLVVLPMRIFSAMLMEFPGRIQMWWETWYLLYCIRSCIQIPFCLLLLLYSNCILLLKLPYITLVPVELKKHYWRRVWLRLLMLPQVWRLIMRILNRLLYRSCVVFGEFVEV